MGRALIWIEDLSVALVMLALIVALTARWHRRLHRYLASVSFALFLILLAASVTWFCGIVKFSYRIQTFPFAYSLSWTIALITGAVIVLACGMRRQGEEAAPAARTWPRGKFALALVALLIVNYITIANLDLAVKVQLAALRAEAGARNLAQTPPPLADRENAAFVYQQAFELLVPSEAQPQFWRKKGNDSWFEYTSGAWDPKDEQLCEFLRTQQPGLALLRRAAAMPSCRLEHDYTFFAGRGRRLPEPIQFAHAATLLAYDAVTKAARGDGPAAMDDVAALFQISRHLDEPFLVALFTAMHVEKQGMRALEDVIFLTPLAPEDLARLPGIDNFSYRWSLQRACQLEETAFGLPSFAMLATSNSAKPLSHIGVFPDSPRVVPNLLMFDLPIYRVFLLSDDLAAYRQVMKEMQELAGRPYIETQEAWQDFYRRWDANRGGILTKSMTPAVIKIAPMTAEGDAVHQLIRVALAMTAFRARNGAFPDKLEDLTPEFLARIPVDPFDGRPLRMKRDGKEIVLYSIGRDLKDDGGIPEEPNKHDGDIVFRLR